MTTGSDDPNDEGPRRLTRREAVLGAAAVLMAACAGGSRSTSSRSRQSSTGTSVRGSAGRASTRPTVPSTACRLTPELTAGPYHLDGHLARRDITEGKSGVPLELRVRVHDLTAGCGPLAGAAVDVWHCDAGGEYSGFNGNSLAATQAGGTNTERFLRGVQRTGADGVATFTTIFPGWYQGRTVHIHLRVLEGGSLGATYQGGHVAHVGQAFFDEATTARVMALDPYRARTGTRTRNEQDSIYRQAGPRALTTLRPRGPAPGYVADFTCVVDPNATPPPAPMF
ncbi:MAG: intradiol ring-cleavage dioxygenase [Acidimicrobiia bacterium]